MQPGTILEPYFFSRIASHVYSVSLTYHLYPLSPIMSDDNIFKSDHARAVVVDDDELQLVNTCSVDNQGGN